MRAKDIMTTDVVTVKPTATVEEVAGLMLDRRVSGIPVVDDNGGIVGMVSEGDLLHRHEIDTERPHSWWLNLVAMPEDRAHEYVKSHGRHVSDVMTKDVVTVNAEMPLADIAALLENQRIKRVPVVGDDVLIGIISRSNLLQALVAQGTTKTASTPVADDRQIREQILQELNENSGARIDLVSVIVDKGVAHLWGIADTEDEAAAMRIAAENVPGVRAVENHTTMRSMLMMTQGA